jgi:hypothetical protein
MALFKKKADPISDRARVLNDEIAALETQIRKLDVLVQQQQEAPPRLRSTALPHGTAPHRASEPAAAPVPEEPIFEEVNRNRLTIRGENGTTPDHYNELGVRKYDLPALLQKIRNHLHGPSTTNPKLVNYLAAGGIQGLRPMRYEKRVARNRFLLLVSFISLVLLGILLTFANH